MSDFVVGFKVPTTFLAIVVPKGGSYCKIGTGSLNCTQFNLRNGARLECNGAQSSPCPIVAVSQPSSGHHAVAGILPPLLGTPWHKLSRNAHWGSIARYACPSCVAAVGLQELAHAQQTWQSAARFSSVPELYTLLAVQTPTHLVYLCAYTCHGRPQLLTEG
eukprot:scaffold226230_cov23-Tisochrysis_lutea.AAC.2